MTKKLCCNQPSTLKLTKTKLKIKITIAYKLQHTQPEVTKQTITDDWKILQSAHFFQEILKAAKTH